MVLTIEEINLGMIKKMKEQAGIHSGIISKVVDTVAGSHRSQRRRCAGVHQRRNQHFQVP